MMEVDGYFNLSGEPIIKLGSGSSHIEVLIDTGFTGSLIMPGQMARELELTQDRGFEEFFTATGGSFLAHVYLVTIVWLGRTIRVPVATCEEVSEAILGGEMLRDCCLTIDYALRTVTIRRN
jgi:clan AA aspartic protease